MKQKECSVICFDKSQVVVRWEGGKAFDVIEFLYKDRSPCASDSTKPHFTLRTKNAQSVLLYHGKKLLYEGEPGKAAVMLLDSVIYELAKESMGGLLFHAAALSRNGRGILMPGQSGSGKTFLTAWLAGDGYDYLTDEMTLVESETFCLNGFYKPLHIKNPNIFKQDICSEEPCESPTTPGYGSMRVDKGVLIDSVTLNPGKRCRSTKAAIIIFPKYEYSAKFDIKCLTSANAGLLLMKSLINARNHTSHGFHEISVLARNVPAYLMTFGDFSRVAREINSLVNL
jgi:hypothetical protein